jgi:hypothetical protein
VSPPGDGERPPEYFDDEGFSDAAMRAERIASGDVHQERERRRPPDQAPTQISPEAEAEVAAAPRVKADRGAAVRSAIPASLAALAEGGLIFLLVRSTVTEATGATTGPLVLLWEFLAVFVVMVAIGAFARGFRWTPVGFIVAGAGLALAQAGSWNGGTVDGATVLLVAIVSMLVALRAATIALHDWNDPAGAAFAWGAFALLGAILIGSHGNFDDVLPIVVALFFAGHLASRTAVILLFGAPTGGATGVGGRILRLAGASLALLLAAFVVFGPVGRRTGLLGFLARIVDPVVGLLAGGLIWVLTQVARPFLWLADRIDIDVEGVQRLLDRLGAEGDQEGQRRIVEENSSLERLVALVLLVGFVLLVVWAIRRQRNRLEHLAQEAESFPSTTPVEGPDRTRTRRRRGRRELPEQTVRRWYAEALVALEDKELERDPSWTPDELLNTAGEHFPEAATGLRTLTRAYERVRYGADTLDRAEMVALDRARRDAVAAIKRSPSLEPATS